MRRLASIAATALLAIPGATNPVHADVLTLADGRETTATVTGIAGGRVTLAQGEGVALDQVRRLRFARPDISPYPSGLLLTDGTRLGGAIRELKPDAVAFRSATLGAITLPLERVAVFYFEGLPAPAALSAPSNGLVRALFRHGGVKDGRLMAITASHVLLRLETGLEKLPLDTLAGLVRAVPAASAEVTLRNGDRLARVAWDGARGTTDAGAGPVTITVDQVREIIFGKTGQ